MKPDKTNHQGEGGYVSLAFHVSESIKDIQARFRAMGLSNDGLSVYPPRTAKNAGLAVK